MSNEVNDNSESVVPWWQPVLFAALAGGMAWGIRGQYGHETGAMIAGLLVSLTLVFLLAPGATSRQVVRAVAGIVLLAAVMPRAVAAGEAVHVAMGERAWHAHFGQAGEMAPGLDTFFENEDVRRAFASGCTWPDWGYRGLHHGAAG